MYCVWKNLRQCVYQRKSANEGIKLSHVMLFHLAFAFVLACHGGVMANFGEHLILLSMH